MMFRERQSESPRVPSPWTNTRRGSASRFSSGNSSRAGGIPDANPSFHKASSSTPSPNFSPLLRAVQVRNAEAMRNASDSTRKAYIDSLENGNESTPPTEDDEDGFCEGLDSFFALDGDFDAQRLSSSQQSSASDILTPLEGMDLPSTSRVGSENRQKRRRKKRIARLAPEPDVLGNLEYKLRIIPPTRHRYDKLLTQMKWRVMQGGGECTYEIGVLDDGLCIGICPLEMQASLSTLSVMAKELNASVLVRKAFEVIALDEHHSQQTAGGEVRLLTNEQAYDLIRVEIDKDRQTICDCGMDANSAKEVVQYLSLFGQHSTRIRSEKNAFDKVYPGEVIIAIEKEIGDMFTYDQEGSKDDESESASCSDEGDMPLEDLSEEFFLEDERETTFSLSLDERATRAGLGFQRRAKTTRRRCRYNVESAMANRPKAKATMADAAVSTTPVVTIENVDLVNTQNAVGMLVDSFTSTSITPSAHDKLSQGHHSAIRTAAVIDENNLTPQMEKKCVRIIVEATIIRDAEEDEEAFIDYGSL